MLLEVRDITVYYGVVKALSDVSFHVESGEIVALIGPNGAGKSTALKAICGVLPATGGRVEKGQIVFNGENINGFRTDQLVRKGLTLVPEGRRVFPNMTVLENLQMGAFTKSPNKSIQSELERVFNIFPRLKERFKQRAGTLSSGEQQMLAIGRALMLKPKLILADEPSLGLSPNYVDLIFETLMKINSEGISILLVEQNAVRALEISRRAYLFRLGGIALEGNGRELLNDVKVKETFLGG